ncbi:hypothetical protein [Bradyrhizobium sp. dw_78]|uniref:hypothetical protein n=1 Tax=Bradyrhizobium sp. dw_78 TaxID=2719793 RepID=UPI001C4A1E18|nr:hypothetical protein [Bradyrhizobium sp. dw_78]
MNIIASDKAAPNGQGLEERRPEAALDAAWNTLEAAYDLGDDATVQACRRVIDASLNGTAASPSDLHIVQHYFR